MMGAWLCALLALFQVGGPQVLSRLHSVLLAGQGTSGPADETEEEGEKAAEAAILARRAASWGRYRKSRPARPMLRQRARTPLRLPALFAAQFNGMRNISGDSLRNGFGAPLRC